MFLWKKISGKERVAQKNSNPFFKGFHEILFMGLVAVGTDLIFY